MEFAASPSSFLPPSRRNDDLGGVRRCGCILRVFNLFRLGRHLQSYASELIKLSAKGFQFLIRQLEFLIKEFTASLEREHRLLPGTRQQCQ